MTDPPSALLQSLAQATSDLLYPSETDAPVEPYRFGDEAPTPRTLLGALELAPDTPVEEASASSFFEGLVEGDDESAARFRELQAILDRELTDLRSYRAGKVDIDAIVLGRDASGAWIGVRTKIVET